jgi:hypothetical protein
MKFDSDLEQRKRAGMLALFALFNFDDKIVAVKLNWYGVGFFYRVDESWELKSPEVDIEGNSDVYEIFIDPDRAIEFIDKWDTQDSELNKEIQFYKASDEVLYEYFPSYKLADDRQRNKTAIVSSASDNFTCPPATQDIMINLENRNKAIKSAGYGPLNPDRPNVDFWEEKAELWSTTVDEAKSSRCGNCAVFIRTPEMLDCLDSGLTQEGSKEAWDAIDAGTLGYCEAFDFKCAAGRTCVAWVAGGPVTGKDKDN